MTELKFSRFFTYFIHREIYNPAEFVCILFHMFFTGCTEKSSEYTGCFLCNKFLSGCKSYKVSRLKTERVYYLFFDVLKKLSDSACNFSILIYFEPICLIGWGNFHIRTYCIYLLSCCSKSVNNNCLYCLSFKRSESAS